MEPDPDKELPDRTLSDPTDVRPFEEDPGEYEGVGADLRNQRYDRVD